MATERGRVHGMDVVGPPGQVIPLRSLTVSDVLDTVFFALRRAGAPILVIIFAVLLPEVLLREFAVSRFLPSGPTLDLQEAVAGLGANLVAALVGLYLGLVVSAAITAVVSGRDRGARLGARDALLLGIRRSGATVGASVILGLGFGVAFVVVLFVGVLLSVAVPVVGLLLAIPAMLLIAAIGYLASVLVIAVAVEEGQGPLATLTRTFMLLRSSLWRSVLNLVLLVIVALVVVAAIGSLGVLVANALGELGWTLQVIGGGMMSAATTPIFAAAGLVLYRDLRVRGEAYDLHVRARMNAVTEVRS